MRRRALLTRGATVAGLVGLMGLAGCSSTRSERPETTRPPVETNVASTPPPSPNKSNKPNKSNEQNESSDAERTRPLDVSPPTVELTDDYATTVQVTVRNDTTEKIRFNPFTWNVWSWTSDGWVRWEPRSQGNGFVDVEPGGTEQWSFDEIVGFIGYDSPSRPGWYAVQLQSVATRSVEFRILDPERSSLTTP